MLRFSLKARVGIKRHEPKWSSTRHQVVGSVNGNSYYISSIAVQFRTATMFVRHELLKA